MFKIKEFINQHKVTVMIIPDAKKSIKQWKFNLSIAFFILIGLIIVNISLLFNTVTSKVEAVSLSSENNELETSLLQTQDRINSLLSINANSAAEIEHLKSSLTTSSDFLKSRLEEMDQAQEYISQLVVLFNEETNSTLPVPVSRSFSRTVEAPETEVAGEFIDQDEILFDEIDALVTNDEISVLINDTTDTYSDLVSQLESQLSYLDARPDFFPASGPISSKFGYRNHPVTGRREMHNGIDINGKKGDPVWAAGSGIVTYAGYKGTYGRLIIIDHGYGYESVYAHNTELLVKEGDSIQKGDQIAKIGSTGRTTGTHLHFEIRYKGSAINPLNILN